jgi:hypothetical protein
MAEGSRIKFIHSPHGYVGDWATLNPIVGTVTNPTKEVFKELFQTHHIWEYCGVRLWSEDEKPHYISMRRNGLQILPHDGAIQDLSSVQRTNMSRARRAPDRRCWAYLRREAMYIINEALPYRTAFAKATTVKMATENAEATKEILEVFRGLEFIR